MSNVTNLRTIRKQAARDQKRAAGSKNAAKHGISKAARIRAAAQEDVRVRKLDAHQIEEQ